MIAANQQAEFDPYHNWLGVPSTEQPPHAYRLLGLEMFENDPDVIEAAAEARLRYVARFLQGSRAATAQRLVAELMAVRDTLLVTHAKQRYDRMLSSRIASTKRPRAPRWRGEPGVRTAPLPLARPAPSRRHFAQHGQNVHSSAAPNSMSRPRWRAITRRIIACTAATGTAIAFTAMLLGVLWMIDLGDPSPYSPPVGVEQPPAAEARLETSSRG